MDRDQASQRLNAIEKVAINHALWCFGVTAVIGLVILFFMDKLNKVGILEMVWFPLFMTIGTYINATRSETFNALVETDKQ